MGFGKKEIELILELFGRERSKSIYILDALADPEFKKEVIALARILRPSPLIPFYIVRLLAGCRDSFAACALRTRYGIVVTENAYGILFSDKPFPSYYYDFFWMLYNVAARKYAFLRVRCEPLFLMIKRYVKDAGLESDVWVENGRIEAKTEEASAFLAMLVIKLIEALRTGVKPRFKVNPCELILLHLARH